MAQTTPLTLHPDRLFPSDPLVRDIARRLYQHIKDLPASLFCQHVSALMFTILPDNSEMDSTIQKNRADMCTFLHEADEKRRLTC